MPELNVESLRPVAERVLAPFVRVAARLGLTPNGVSAIAFVFAGAAGGVYAFAGADRRLYLLGAVFVLLNGWLDLLDGALARRMNIDSPGGDLLDHVLDRYADILVIVGLAAGIERYALGLAAITGVLMTSYLGTQAQAVGLERVYGGVLGRANRLALVGLVTALASALALSAGGLSLVAWLLAVFAVVGHFTALQRFVLAYRALSGR